MVITATRPRYDCRVIFVRLPFDVRSPTVAGSRATVESQSRRCCNRCTISAGRWWPRDTHPNHSTSFWRHITYAHTGAHACAVAKHVLVPLPADTATVTNSSVPAANFKTSTVGDECPPEPSPRCLIISDDTTVNLIQAKNRKTNTLHENTHIQPKQRR